MRQTLLAALLTLPLCTFAAPPPSPAAPRPRGLAHPVVAEKRGHLMLLVGIADELDLSEPAALKLGARLRDFEQRRKPLREKMGESKRALQRAAAGDSAAVAQVDSATQKLFESRLEMARLDQDMFNTLAQELTAQQKAKLALFLGKFRHHMMTRGGPMMHGAGAMHGCGAGGGEGCPGSDEP